MGHPENGPQVISPCSSGDREHEKAQEENHHSKYENQRPSLDLQSQDLVTFPSSHVIDGASLVHLCLNNNRIPKLPPDLGKQLPQLEILRIDSNELTSLPEDFGELTHLQELSVCDNQLLSLPESLGRLTALRTLKATHNLLKEIHYEVGQNVSLEELIVDNNKLRHLPATFALLQKLKVLKANNNQIEQLPLTLIFLKSLEVVDLSSNRLTHISQSLGMLTNLKWIDFSENRLSSLGDRFASSTILEKLFLDFNFFTKCPTWFKDLERIVEIRMINNDLSGAPFPEGFGSKSPHLRRLDFSGNAIEELPQSFCHLTGLETLLLGMPQDCLNIKVPKLRYGNWLTQLPASFSNLQSLTELHAEENRLNTVPDDIGNLGNLKALYLGSNNISTLPASITSLTALERLQLSKNCLRHLPDDFGKLESLRELYLDCNQLKDLPKSMKKLVNLEVFDVSENRLRDVPKDIVSPMVKLRQLNLYLNCYGDLDTQVCYLMKKSMISKNDLQLQRNDENRALDIGGKVRNVSLDWADIERVWACAYGESSSPSSVSSVSSDEQFSEDTDEEDWESQIPQEADSSHSQSGIFDLDDEEPEKPLTFIPSPVRFDMCGNPTRQIEVDVQIHRSTPYVNHAPSISRFLYYPVPAQPNQFDDADDEDEGTPVDVPADQMDIICDCDNENEEMDIQLPAAPADSEFSQHLGHVSNRSSVGDSNSSHTTCERRTQLEDKTQSS